MKKIIAKTNLKPDYKNYLYVCAVDKETGNLNIIRVDKSLRSKGIKKKK